MAIRWGICSAGNICHDFVVALKSSCVTNHKVVAVGARSKESAAKFAETHNIPNSYGSYEEVAEDPEVPYTSECETFGGHSSTVLRVT